MNPDTFTSKELCARYGCAQVTIRRKEAEEGFPHGERFGRKLIYAKEAVHAWERAHMPHLHIEPEQTEDDKHWDRLRRRHQLEQEERADVPDAPQPQKPKRQEKAARRRSA